MSRRLLGIGNCQIEGMIQCAAGALGLVPVYMTYKRFLTDGHALVGPNTKTDLVFAQGAEQATMVRDIARNANRPDLPIIQAPKLFFRGFHPDMVTPTKRAGKCPQLPLGTANSAILLSAWQHGLSADDARSLFRGDVYDALGYYDAYAEARELLVEACRQSRLDVTPMIGEWLKAGAFFHVPLHPKIRVLNDIAFALLRNAGLHDGHTPAAPEDLLAPNISWPVYPEIAERLGLTGDYEFRPDRRGPAGRNPAAFSLDEFIDRTFEGYRRSPPVFASFPRMGDARLQSIGALLHGDHIETGSFGSTGWMEEEEVAAGKVVCDEELLDPDNE